MPVIEDMYPTPTFLQSLLAFAVDASEKTDFGATERSKAWISASEADATLSKALRKAETKVWWTIEESLRTRHVSRISALNPDTSNGTHPQMSWIGFLLHKNLVCSIKGSHLRGLLARSPPIRSQRRSTVSPAQSTSAIGFRLEEHGMYLELRGGQRVVNADSVRHTYPNRWPSVKVCVPGERHPDGYDLFGPPSVEERCRIDHNYVLEETRVYDDHLRPLQGTVVPRFFGLWKATTPDTGEVVYIMLVELVENAITSHQIPGGR